MTNTHSRLTRRRFTLSLCSIPICSALPGRMAGEQPGPWSGPAEVAKVYLSAPRTHWPSPTLDVEREVAEVESRLAEVERKHAGKLSFTGSRLLRTTPEVEAWGKSLGDADAVLAIPISTPSVPVAAVADAAGRPVLCFSRPFAGHHWASVADLRRSGRKVDVLASSSYGDLDMYAPIFETIHHLRGSKVLVASDRNDRFKALAGAFTGQFGTRFQFLGYEDLQTVFQQADARRAQAAARELAAGALRVIEPTPKEIEDGLRFYLAMESLLAREKANAVTVDCFPGLLAHKLPGYPCIAWSKLNDRGMYGVCEADIRSTMTQLLVTPYSGMPGFVSDPVFDTSREEVVHAHCVSATRMKGIGGPASPYILRNHLETNEGAVLQVLMPAGETITVAEFADARRMLVSTALVTGTTSEISGTPDSDGGCRTKIRTRVEDARKWLENYTAGLHRVIFYGNHVEGIERMGRLMGFAVTKEI